MNRLRQRITGIVDERIKYFFDQRDHPKVKFYILPGGKRPKRATDGSVGFDFFLRAIVSPHEMDPDNKVLRKNLFNFKNAPKDNPFIERHIVVAPAENRGVNGNELA